MSTGPASDYLVVEDPDSPSTYHLRVKKNGTPDHGLMGGAWAALTSNYRGNPYSGPDKAKALAKLKALYKSEGMDLPKQAAESPMEPCAACMSGNAGDCMCASCQNNQPCACCHAIHQMTAPPQKDRQAESNPDMRPDDPDEDEEDTLDDDDALTYVDTGDVHVNAPVGALPTPGNKSPYGARLVKRLRDALRGRMALSGDEIEGHIASARGHAGGTASAAAKKARKAGEPNPTDPDGDGDDDTTEEGDTDNDYAGAHPPREVPKRAKESPYVNSSTGEAFRLFVAADLSRPDEWIPYLPKPGVFKHPAWGDIVLSRERNANFVRNFNAGVYQSRIPLDAEHQTKLSGAMGWIDQLRQNADGSVDAHVEWTDRGAQMLAGGRYRYISPEFFEEWPDPATGEVHHDIATGGALCTRPFFKESSLRPLVATEGALTVDDSPLQEYAMTETATAPAPEAQAPNQATEPQAFAELQAELEKQRQLTEAAQAEVKQATEAIAAMRQEKRLQSFTETARAFAGDTAQHVAIMDALPDDLRAQYVTSQRAQAEQIKAGELFKPRGIAGRNEEGSAAAQLHAFAEKMVNDSATAGKPMSMPEAYAVVLSDPRNRDLYDRYNSEMRA